MELKRIFYSYVLWNFKFFVTFFGNNTTNQFLILIDAQKFVQIRHQFASYKRSKCIF